MRNVYLVVTDLHLGFTKANRLNYFGEVLSAMTDIMKIAIKYQDKGYTVYQCLLGDVFDGSITDASNAMQAIELFRYYCSAFTKTWSVVGNHELTYVKDNPFWFLVSNMHDDSLKVIQRYIQPRGIEGVIEIPDVVVDGNTTLYFNHFGVNAKMPKPVGVPVGLFHQNVGSNDICRMYGTFDNVEDASFINGYRYCFFGHMHLAKGKYYLSEDDSCQGEWLGTIGRTKVDEILDDSLNVNIPAIIVEDGEFKRVEDNMIMLAPRKECIDFAKLEASKKSRAILMEKKQIVSTKFRGDTLFHTLEMNFENSALGFLLGFLDRPWEEVVHEYGRTLATMRDDKDVEVNEDVEC